MRVAMGSTCDEMVMSHDHEGQDFVVDFVLEFSCLPSSSGLINDHVLTLENDHTGDK